MFLGVGIVVSGILFYLLTYYLNKNTPLPDGLETKIDKATCDACNISSCGARQE